MGLEVVGLSKIKANLNDAITLIINCTTRSELHALVLKGVPIAANAGVPLLLQGRNKVRVLEQLLDTVFRRNVPKPLQGNGKQQG